MLRCDHPCERLFVSTHAEITIHSYKNGLSEICKNGQSILVRMDCYVSTHAKIMIHSYKNGLSEICKNGQSILVRMDRYFCVSGDLRVIVKHVERVYIQCIMHRKEK